MLNKDDPIKGALIGGTLGFGGGTVLGPAMGASGAAGSVAPGTVVGAGGAGSGGGITALSVGGEAPLTSLLGTPVGPGAAGGIKSAALPLTGPFSAGAPLTAGLPMAPTGMGATGAGGVLGQISTSGSASAPFAAAAGAPTMFSTPFSLGTNQAAQLNAANNMMRQPQQQQQVRAPKPMPIQRGQAMKYPTLDELYKMQMAQAAPRFSLL
jgi:hypothetical protein